MTQPDAWRMMRRRAIAAGIHAPIGNHSFRATGSITTYLSNGGALERTPRRRRRTESRARRRSALRSDEGAARDLQDEVEPDQVLKPRVILQLPPPADVP